MKNALLIICISKWEKDWRHDVDRIFDTDHDSFILFFLSFLFSLSPQKQDVQHQYGNSGGKCSRGKWGISLLLKEEFNSLAVDDVTH